MSDDGLRRDGGEENSADIRGESLSDALDVLADEKRRCALHFFQSQSKNVASVEDLAEYILAHECEADDVNHVRVALHHQDLPSLDDAGLIDYDARSNTVRYYGDSTTEDLLEYLSNSE